MITIRSGKLTIPEEDRFVGFAGDNLGSTKTFVIPGRGSDSGSYTLCLRFDDDSVRVIPLTKSISDSNLVLTWTIRSEHLLKPGIVMAQVKSVDSEDVILHTSCDFFIVANGAEYSGGGDPDYVVREELEERMTAFLECIRASAPYIGEDGYWYIYDAETDTYVRSAKATPDYTVDAALTAGGTNPVQGGAIKSYVDAGLDAKVAKTTVVAGLPLSGNITRAELAENISGFINPRMVEPGTTIGYGGQFGKTSAGDPVMCSLGSTWIRLATENSVNTKMSLAPTADDLDFSGIPAGQIFFCQGGMLIKTANSYFELAKKSNVYSKFEIDVMIGNLETVLSGV